MANLFNESGVNTLAPTVSFGEGAYLVDFCLTLMGSEDTVSRIFTKTWEDYAEEKEPNFNTSGGQH
mgnify:CR=1 FL=1